MTKIAIIGGSGLEDPSILQNPKEVEVKTPYGDPSSSFKCGEISGIEVAIYPVMEEIIQFLQHK